MTNERGHGQTCLYRKILFVGDGTGHESPNALGHAMALASECCATLTILDVVPQVSTDDAALDSQSRQLQTKLIEDRVAALQAVAGPGEPEVRVVAGKPCLGWSARSWRKGMVLSSSQRSPHASAI